MGIGLFSLIGKRDRFSSYSVVLRFASLRDS
jgi:hypothetical protein